MADRIVNVLSICGSLRKGSYNRIVMNHLQGLAPPVRMATRPSRRAIARSLPQISR